MVDFWHQFYGFGIFFFTHVTFFFYSVCIVQLQFHGKFVVNNFWENANQHIPSLLSLSTSFSLSIKHPFCTIGTPKTYASCAMQTNIDCLIAMALFDIWILWKNIFHFKFHLCISIHFPVLCIHFVCALVAFIYCLVHLFAWSLARSLVCLLRCHVLIIQFIYT